MNNKSNQTVPDSTATTQPSLQTTESKHFTQHKVLVFNRFNRLWHWSQALSIVILLVTGFRIAGLYALFSFKIAVVVHTITALALLILWIFATFWLFTTGVWQQFIPRFSGLLRVMRFYAYGVFKGEKHPYHRVLQRRHNPLQALSYFLLKTLLFPAIWSTGILYLTHGLWMQYDLNNLWFGLISAIHTLAAFAIAAFVMIHTYLLTVGHGFKHHVRPMITGYDDMELTDEELAYIKQRYPNRLRDK